MIPVTQRGDSCWLSCVASILEVPLEELPGFEEHGRNSVTNPERFIDLHRWLARRNICVIGDFLYLLPTKALPPVPGYSTLSLRVTDTVHELHALVCFNSEVVWDPNGFRLPRDWNGLIEGRSWQVARPVSFTRFLAIDPSQPTGTSAIHREQVRQNAVRMERLFGTLYSRDHHPSRPGADYGAFLDLSGHLAAAYCDASTEVAGLGALHEAVTQMREQVLAAEARRNPQS